LVLLLPLLPLPLSLLLLRPLPLLLPLLLVVPAVSLSLPLTSKLLSPPLPMSLRRPECRALLLLLPPLPRCACHDDSWLLPSPIPLRPLLPLLLLPSQLRLLPEPLPLPLPLLTPSPLLLPPLLLPCKGPPALLASSAAAGGGSSCLPAPLCSSLGKLIKLVLLPATIAASADAERMWPCC
jgi:hypothetical protein